MAKRIQQLYAQAVEYLDAGNPQDALPLLRSCAQAAPKSGAIQVTLATCLLDVGETGDARIAFERMLKDEKTAQHFGFQVHGNLAQLHSEGGDAKQAIHHYDAALKIERDWFEGHYNIANLLSDQGSEFEARALHHYECAVNHEDGKRSADAHNNYGVCLQNAGRLDKARAECALACALDPKHASAKYNLSSCCQQSGQMQHATRHCLEALTLSPDYHQAQAQMAVLLNEQGAPQQALPYFSKAIALVSKSRLKSDDAKAAQSHDDAALHYGLMKYFTLRGLSCENDLEDPASIFNNENDRLAEEAGRRSRKQMRQELEDEACVWAREHAGVLEKQAFLACKYDGPYGKDVESIDTALLYILAGDLEKAAERAKDSAAAYLGVDKCENVLDVPVSKLGILCQKCSLFSGAEELTHKAKLASNIQRATDLVGIVPESHIVESLKDIERVLIAGDDTEGTVVWYLKDPHMQRGQGIHIFKASYSGGGVCVLVCVCVFDCPSFTTITTPPLPPSLQFVLLFLFTPPPPHSHTPAVPAPL
jgi:tetratricopeptide (TPR) repeat protein